MLLAAVHLTHRWIVDPASGVKRGLGAGALLVAACLIRPIALLLVGVMAVSAWVCAGGAGSRLRAWFCGALLAGNLAVIAPWEIWARQQTGAWIPLSTNGPDSITDGLTFSASRGELSPVGLALPDDVQDLALLAMERLPELTSTRAIAGFLVDQTVERPVTFAKFLAIKAARSWYGTDSQLHEDRTMLVQAPYLFLAAVGLALSWRGRNRERASAILALAVTLYFGR